MQKEIIQVVFWRIIISDALVKLIRVSEIFHTQRTINVFVLLAHHLHKNETNPVSAAVQAEAHPPGESQHALTLSMYTAGAPITQLLCPLISAL